MALIRALWDAAYLGAMPDFKEAPYDLGSFDEIAHYRGGRAGRPHEFTAGFEVAASWVTGSGEKIHERVCRYGDLELPRFRGHLILLGGGGIRNAEIETAVCGGVPPADGRAGPVGTHAGGSGTGVRAVGPGHPEIGWRRPAGMPASAPTACAPGSVRRCAGCVGRTVGCGKSRRYGWYNTRRRHSASDCLSPLDFERLRETAPADGDRSGEALAPAGRFASGAPAPAGVVTGPARPSAGGTPPHTAVSISASRIPPPPNRIRCPRNRGNSKAGELVGACAGVRVETKQVERTAEALGRQIAADERTVNEPAPTPAPTMYLGLAGTGVPVRPSEVEGRPGKQPDGSARTREAKLVTVWTAEQRDKRGRPVRDPDRSATIALRYCRLSGCFEDLSARGEIPAAFDGRCIPAELRRSSVAYGRYAPSSRLVSRAPRPSLCDAGISPRAVMGATSHQSRLTGPSQI